MDKIIFATGNEHKMIEIRAILSDLGVEILSQKEAGIKADVIEDGMTFEENAMIIEEILNQRIEGIKNEKGVYVTSHMRCRSMHMQSFWQMIPAWRLII